MRRVGVSVLGPVTVDVDGVERAVSARRPRAVLACLAVQSGRAVSADRLLEAVWGDNLPDTGAGAVAHQISRLRNLLEPDRTADAALITTSPAGYTLDVAPDDVDALHFERLVEQARAALPTDPAGCEQLLTEALAIWRGSPFADLGDEPFVEHEARRLDQLRVVARRSLAEARIALGRAGEVVGELETLVADLPLDESLTALLMTVLHNSGRTAEALRAYAELRQRLSTELGIEPSNELKYLEQRLLAGDDNPAGIGDTGIRARSVPAAATSFVGRVDELAELAEWLESARLVTLCGFGGLGKTRLAQEVARAINDRFPDGVWYVDLAPIADPAVLPDTIIAAGGLTPPRDRDPVEHLLTQVADREALLVLDNCEHLVDDAGELVDRIVREAPLVRVLATSRAHLGVRGEAVFTVHPLPTHSAVELFTDRARLARTGLAVGDRNRHDVERLVDRLDGIPLAIEMAAARLSVMSPDQITEHLDDRFRLLTTSHRVPDERQRSLAAVLEWSYDLLDPSVQQLLRRLSVCAGGFDLDAAHQIGSRDPSTAAFPDTVDGLGHLVGASLVDVADQDGVSRYRMLETVRQHASAQLDPDERALVALAHATHYESVATTIFDLANTDHGAAFRLGDRELANLRAAMSWAFQNGQPRLGLSIARSARIIFFTQLLDRELLGWLRTGLDLVRHDDDDTLEAASAAAHAASNILDEEARRRFATRVERGLDIVEDPRVRADLLSGCASPLLETDPRGAEAYMKAAIELRAALPWRAVAYLSNRVDQSWYSGDLDDAASILRRLDEIGDVMPGPGPVRAKIRAGVAARRGRWDEVVDMTGRATGEDPYSEAGVQALRVEALAALGRHDEALAVLDGLDRDSTEYRRVADLLHASIDLRRGAPRAAGERLTELADQIRRHGRWHALGMQIASLLAVAATDLGRHEAAAILFGYAESEQQRLDIVLRPSDRPLVESATRSCREALGPERFDQLDAQGADTEWRDLPVVDFDTP